MEEKAEYGCSLCVNTGDEHPELTGIQPTSIEVKGETKQLKNVKDLESVQKSLR